MARSAAGATSGSPTGDGQLVLAGAPLAARPQPRSGHRQRLRRPRVPGSRGPAQRHLHHPPAPGCRPLRARTAAGTRHGRTPPDQGRPASHPHQGAGRPRHDLVPRHYPRLVWRRRQDRRDLLRHGRLASWGMPIVPIRWVLLRDPQRRFDPQALLCTDLARSRSRSSPGSSSDGRWRSPSARCATTLASRPAVSGRTAPSRAPHPACSACSRW
jgi:hypothetical protein